MKKINSLSKVLLMVVVFSALFLLGGCDYTPEALEKNGLDYFKKGDYLLSTCSYKFLLDKQPDNPGGYYGLGINYSKVGGYDDAIVNFKKAIELSGNTAYQVNLDDFYLELAKAYYKNAQYEEAGKTLKKLNTMNPSLGIANEENLFQFTRMYDQANMIKEAIDLHNRYKYAETDLPGKYSILSYLKLRDHNYDFAFDRASLYTLGMASGEKGQYLSAIQFLRNAALNKKKPGENPKIFFPINISLAYYLAKNGQYDAALDAYNDAIDVTKVKYYGLYYNHPIWKPLLGCYVYERRYKAVNIYYDDYLSQLAMAHTYYSAGRYDEAFSLLCAQIASLERGEVGIVVFDSDSLKANKYIMLIKQGSPAEKAGLKFWDIIVSVDGKKVKGRSVQDFVNLVSGPAGTEVTLKIERFEDPVKKEGKTVFDKKIIRENLKSKNELNQLAKAYGLRSLIYRAKGEFENASADAQKAISYDPDSFDAGLAWGLAQNNMGKYNEALKILSSVKLSESETLYGFEKHYFIIPFAYGEELIKLGKANAYFKIGKVNDAFDCLPRVKLANSLPPIQKEFEVLTSELTELAQAHNTKAVNLQQKGLLKEALNEYTTALSYTRNDKQEEEIRNNYINLLQKHPVSQEISEEARKYHVRGELLLKQGDLAGALNECMKGLKLAPYYTKFYFNIAQLNSGLKKYNEAIKYMNIYLKLAPNAPDIQMAQDETTKWELLQEKTR